MKIFTPFNEYGIKKMDEIDELDRHRAAYTLFSKLQKAEERAEQEGWIDADELVKELGVSEEWMKIRAK